MTDDRRLDPMAADVSPRDDLSMSTDNTAEGRLDADTVEGGPIAFVREGQTVVDSLGEEIGKVAQVRMGDPSAATTRGEESHEPESILDVFAEGLFGTESNLPESTRNEFIRTGYIQIDGKGLFGRDYAVAAAQIANVTGDRVSLTVDRGSLVSV
ncbi:MAG: hypothetical protein M3464_09080 [Chloroflexota bacterium]|nr:hypothetical protein [Chloroflexota bacterium]